MNKQENINSEISVQWDNCCPTLTLYVHTVLASIGCAVPNVFDVWNWAQMLNKAVGTRSLRACVCVCIWDLLPRQLHHSAMFLLYSFSFKSSDNEHKSEEICMKIYMIVIGSDKKWWMHQKHEAVCLWTSKRLDLALTCVHCFQSGGSPLVFLLILTRKESKTKVYTGKWAHETEVCMQRHSDVMWVSASANHQLEENHNGCLPLSVCDCYPLPSVM